MTKTKKKTLGGARPGAGRPRRFREPTETGALHLPPSFWETLDELGQREELSRSQAFVMAIKDEKLVRRLVRSLK